MVIKNTPANRTLVRKLRDAVNAYVSLRAAVHFNWNCGKDIRFEIGVCVLDGFDPPVLVVTDVVDGALIASVRLLARDSMNSYETLQLGCLLTDIDRVIARIEDIASAHGPIVCSDRAA